MIKINFYLNSLDDRISPFELGDFELCLNEEVLITSKNTLPPQSMMVFISALDLLNGINRLQCDKKRFLFIGADSSFAISFIKKKTVLEILHFRQKIKLNFDEFCLALYKSVMHLYMVDGSPIKNEPMVMVDLKNGICRFKETFKIE